MGRIVVLGESAAVEAYALAGAQVICAESPADVRRAWAAVPSDAEVVVLSAAAASVLGEAATGLAGVLAVAMG